MYIHECLEKRGVSPSFDEMKLALDLKSKSGIHRLITALTERGFIRRLPHRARALEILRLPDDVSTIKPITGNGEASLNVVTGDFGSENSLSANAVGPAANDASAVNLPLYGRIAAGTAIEALSDPTSFVDIPAGMLGSGNHYCLEVAGDSMIEAGINDGDTVVIEECKTAENGKIVVALIDDQEVTLKRLRKKGDSVALEAANPDYETRIFGPDRVKVQGKLIGLFRQY